jgi:putative endonuclease
MMLHLSMWLARFHPLLRRPWRRPPAPPADDGRAGKPPPDQRRAIGRLGEDLAALALRARGCKLLHRNFKGPYGGEVDLVLRDRRTLVFAEVKTRLSLLHGRPAEAVTPAKQDLVRRGAREWLARLHRDDIRVRFDVVEVILRDGQPPEINVVRDAFGDR